MMQVQFILNPISGTKEKSEIPQLIEEHLDKRLYDYTIRYTEYAGHAREIAEEAARQGIDIVVAVGGDGTVNEIGCGLTGTSTALGILPCGSGNGLARHLNIPVSIKGSLDILNRNCIKTLDYCTINGHPFFCTCGMGFDAFISQKFSESKRRGPATYVENVLREGLRYQPETYTIEDESGRYRYQAYLVACANASQYGNNAYIAPQASMSDGLLDVIVIEPFDLLDAPQISFDLMNKTLNKSVKVKTFTAKKVHIHRKQEGPVHFDGDPMMMGTDIEVAVVEHGIRMVVNPDSDDNAEVTPNLLQSTISELFNEVSTWRSSINHQRRNMIAMNKKLIRKLTK